jgi:hypothetical protein
MTPPPLLPSFIAKKSSGSPIALPFKETPTKRKKNVQLSFFREKQNKVFKNRRAREKKNQ